jgi:hypothetical protein
VVRTDESLVPVRLRLEFLLLLLAEEEDEEPPFWL